MNRKAIAKTALCKFDSKQKCFVVQSPLFERCIGVAKTEAEAQHIFFELLDEYYVAYLEGKLVGYEKRGRPAKGYVDFHVQVKPLVKKGIATRAQELGISQGEIIDYLYHLEESKKDLEERLEKLQSQVQKRNVTSRRSASA